MRIENWRSKEIFKAIEDRALENANAVMDEVAVAAKAKLQSSVKVPPIVRKGHFGSAHVSFIPKTGRNKGNLVEFNTDKRWTGRHYTEMDTLVDTIRRVNKPGSGNVRVYAGNFLAYWAFMIEKGFHDRAGAYHAGIHFLQKPFHEKKINIENRIKNGGGL